MNDPMHDPTHDSMHDPTHDSMHDPTHDSTATRDWSEALTGWQALGVLGPETLIGARLQLHWAAQVVASVGITHLEPRSDDSHTNLEWFAALGALAGNEIPAERPYRVALGVADFTLLLIDGAGEVIDGAALSGRTLDDAYAWVRRAIASHTGGAHDRELSRPIALPPAHAVSEGRAFQRDVPGAFTELARWYANGDHLLRALRPTLEGASPVRCWPHHFDIATLSVPVPDPDPERVRSIGVGMTPGDDHYAEPYVYVVPWPRPMMTVSPSLAGGGHWHTEGWFGAVLAAGELPRDGVRQREQVVTFIDSAVAAARTMLRSRMS